MRRGRLHIPIYAHLFTYRPPYVVVYMLGSSSGERLGLL